MESCRGSARRHNDWRFWLNVGQMLLLVFALMMMAGLLVSLVIRRRRVWVRVMPSPQTPGTVSVELGGLARTDNSGWGDEFERLTQRLLAGFDAAAAQPSREKVT